MSQPKNRSVNFTKSEEEKLVTLALEKKHILENKKTDAVSSKQKDTAWENLAQKFNASNESNIIRTSKVLREKYMNIKRSLRRTKANARREIFMTGGGPPSKEKENSNPVLSQLSDVMGVSVDGLPPRHDDDQTMSIDDLPIVVSEEIIDFENANNVDLLKDYFMGDIIGGETSVSEAAKIINATTATTTATTSAITSAITSSQTEKGDEIGVDWSKYRPAMLRNKKNPLLKAPKSSKSESGSFELVALKKMILEQQLEQSRLQHEQKMEHARIEHEQHLKQSAEEHEMKMKILDAELKSKQMSDN